MSLINTISEEISSVYHRKCIPSSYNIDSEVVLERLRCFCHRTFPYPCRNSVIGRGSTEFDCPVKETVTISESKLKGYIMFDCRHWITYTKVKSERIFLLE